MRARFSAAFCFAMVTTGVMMLAFVSTAAHAAFHNDFLLYSSKIASVGEITPSRGNGAFFRAETMLPSSILQHKDNDESGVSMLHEKEHLYRNRSLLLERALQQKLQALHLSDQKLLVLQDAAHRMVGKQVAREQSELTRIRKEQESTMERERQNWQAERMEMRKRQASLDEQCHNLRKERDDTVILLDTIRADYSRSMDHWRIQKQELEQSHDREHENLESAAILALQQEHQDAMIGLQKEFSLFQLEHATTQALLYKEKRRNRHYRAKIQAFIVNNNSNSVSIAFRNTGIDTLRPSLLVEPVNDNKLLGDATDSTDDIQGLVSITSNNVPPVTVGSLSAEQASGIVTEETPFVTKEVFSVEQMEIAQSAVAAAANREAAAHGQYQTLQQSYDLMVQEKQILQEQLERLVLVTQAATSQHSDAQIVGETSSNDVRLEFFEVPQLGMDNVNGAPVRLATDTLDNARKWTDLLELPQSSVIDTFPFSSTTKPSIVNVSNNDTAIPTRVESKDPNAVVSTIDKMSPSQHTSVTVIFTRANNTLRSITTRLRALQTTDFKVSLRNLRELVRRQHILSQCKTFLGVRLERSTRWCRNSAQRLAQLVPIRIVFRSTQLPSIDQE